MHDADCVSVVLSGQSQYLFASGGPPRPDLVVSANQRRPGGDLFENGRHEAVTLRTNEAHRAAAQDERVATRPGMRSAVLDQRRADARSHRYIGEKPIGSPGAEPRFRQGSRTHVGLDVNASYSGEQLGQRNAAPVDGLSTGDLALKVYQLRYAYTDAGIRFAGWHLDEQPVGQGRHVRQDRCGIPPRVRRNNLAACKVPRRKATQATGDLGPANVQADRPDLVMPCGPRSRQARRHFAHSGQHAWPFTRPPGSRAPRQTASGKAVCRS